MKKIGLLLSLLFILPLCTLAAENPAVKEIDAKSDGTTISYTGTMESGSFAVMCKLYNSKDEEIDLLSSAVDNNKFEGKFTVSGADTYTLACANYEGGEIKKVEVLVEDLSDKTKDDKTEEAKTETPKNDKIEDNKNNPKTGDNYTSLIFGTMISLVGIMGATLYIKRKKLI